MAILDFISKNWIPLLTIINSIAITIIAILEFKKKKYGPHLEIECEYPENSKLSLVKEKNDFKYFILKATLTNNGSETALIKRIHLFPPSKINPPNVLVWDGSIHVKEIGYKRGEEFWRGVMSLPSLSTPFGLKPKEEITLFFLIKPKKDYLKYKEVKAQFYLHIYYSKKKELHWGPINLLWASKKRIEEINKIELDKLKKKWRPEAD